MKVDFPPHGPPLTTTTGILWMIGLLVGLELERAGFSGFSEFQIPVE